MSRMFEECSKLESLDASGWDTSNVKDMHYMFYDCSKLEDMDISSLDRSNAATSKMFTGTILE